MNSIIEIAWQNILNSSDIAEENLSEVLQLALGSGIDFADLYFQSIQKESWSLEEGIIRSGGFSTDKGVGVRAVSEDKTGFAYTDDLNLKMLREIASAARSIVQHGKSLKVNALSAKKVAFPSLYPSFNPLMKMIDDDKTALLKMVDAEARKQDPRVKQVLASLQGSYETVLIAASDGTLAADIRPLVRLNVTVVVEENDRRETGTFGGGCRGTFQFFLEKDRGLEYAREAVRVALINLYAISAPAGTMPVVLGNGWSAVLLHEAVGHGLEGDFIRKNSSVYANKIGTRIASPECTIVDQGNLPDARRGSINIDDEGTPTQCTTLIENGILRGFMFDKMNANLMHTKTTGNGRRQSYAYAPIPRMTNTFMMPGKYSPEEIIASVKKGLYAANFHGGQVDITSGEFVFSTSEAYLIENGKITAPVKGATLIGNGPKILNKVTMVGNDLKLDGGVGTCGKDGQSVPVGVGQPTLKVAEITVGGTEN